MSATETIPSDDVASSPQLPAPAPATIERAAPPSKADRPAKQKAAKKPKEPKHAKPAPRTTKVVLRKLDAWAVLKLSFVFYLALFIVVLVAVVLLWAGATSVGVVSNIESFMVDIGFSDFKFVPNKMLGGVALGGLVLVVAGTCANVLVTALFNLMGNVVGGLKLTLQEEREVTRKTKDKDKGKDGGKATV